MNTQLTIHNTNVCSYFKAEQLGYSVGCDYNLIMVDETEKSNDQYTIKCTIVCQAQQIVHNDIS